MRMPIEQLNGRHFDVLVIGAGANGASAAQHLAARGYNILVVDKGDFASGTSSRSSRLLHCGLQYLAHESSIGGQPSIWSLLRKPWNLVGSVAAARNTMNCRTHLVRNTSERVKPVTFFYPMFNDSAYRPWQVDMGFRLLTLFAPRDVPLKYKRITGRAAAELPMMKWLGRRDSLTSVGTYQEYRYDWAERICVDSVLDAERMGATVRNYAPVRRLIRRTGSPLTWEAEIEDGIDGGGRAVVTSNAVLNTAGPWIDDVNKLSDARVNKRYVIGIKGVNLLVKLPEDCHGFGVICLSSLGHILYLAPWDRYHILGPTSDLYEGEPDKVRPLNSDIEYLLNEANRLFPAFYLTPADVIYAWAGVRVRTFTEHEDIRRRPGQIHDLGLQGMPNAFALTETPIMLHRHAGARLAKAIARRLRPSRQPQPPDFAAKAFPKAQNSAPVSSIHPEVRCGDLKFAVQHEHATNLVDLMFRRVNMGWNADMGETSVSDVAKCVSDLLGWDDAKIQEEVDGYRSYIRDNFRFRSAN